MHLKSLLILIFMAVVAGCGWIMPGELAVYGGGHPPVYSIGLAMGDRHSQYDLWPGPVGDPDRFKGQTFIIVGGVTDVVREAFDLEPTREITFLEHGQPIASWQVTVGHQFRGFRTKAQQPDSKPPY